MSSICRGLAVPLWPALAWLALVWSRVVGWRPGWSRVADVLGAGGRGEAGRAGERRTPALLTSQNRRLCCSGCKVELSRRLFWDWFGLDQDRVGGLSEGEDSNRVCEGNLLGRLAWSDSKWKWFEGAGCVFSGELSLMHSS